MSKLSDGGTHMDVDLQGKTALIAGGTGGLGRAVALAFLNAGAHVAVTYRKRDEITALQADAGTRTSLITPYSIDVTDDASVRAAVADIVLLQGRIDILVNTVGAYTGGIKLWDLEP